MADNIDVVRDAPARPQAPVDPNVHVPDSARRAAAAADALHKQAYQAQSPAPEPAPESTLEQPAPPASVVTPELDGVAREEFAADPDLQGKYDRMVASMNGRLKQKDDVIGGMNEQLNAMGTELSRLTTMLERGTMPQVQTPVQSALTAEDREFAGDQLLDVVRKVAGEVVAPIVASQQHAEQNQRRTAAKNFYTSLDQQFPEWRTINRSDEFKSWLRLPDVYSGRVRQSLLNDAVQSADALRALQFFKGFKGLAESGTPSPQLNEPPQSIPSATPRQAATTLQALAAPGRAQPAGGSSPTTPAATEKPIYTRQNISDFYAHKRLLTKGQGYYVGKEAEMNQTESDIIRAQGEGRVRG